MMADENPFAKYITEAPPSAPMALPEVDLPKWPALPEAPAGPEAGNPFQKYATPDQDYERYQRTGRIRITPSNAPDPNLLPKSSPEDEYQPQGPRQAPVGKGTAALVGAGSGATFNFADEYLGLLNAALAGKEPGPEGTANPLTSHPALASIPAAVGAARLGWEMLTGED